MCLHSYENDFDLHENGTACGTHFHMKGFALRLVLKQRHKRTRKWPITWLSMSFRSSVDKAPRRPVFGRSWVRLLSGTQIFFFVPRSSHVDEFTFHIVMFVSVFKEGQMKFGRILQVGLTAPSIMFVLCSCFQIMSVILIIARTMPL